MVSGTDGAALEAPPSGGRVHIVGAGPVGLMLAALLQPMDDFDVHLYEKRDAYTRKRMVQLASYLVADSVESYRTDAIDADQIEAIFDSPELDEGLAFRQSIPADLSGLLRDWTRGFVPLNAIERSVSDLIDRRTDHPITRVHTDLSQDEALALLEPGDVLIDCTGARSLLRDGLTPGSVELGGGANTLQIRLEYALVVTFLYGQPYDCNEYCKYYKNAGNALYKFIPMVNRTHYDGEVSHVCGIVNITADDYAAMPTRFDGAWLRENYPVVAESMDRFIGKVKEETQGELLGDLEIIRIPLDVYRARNATNRRWLMSGPADHPFATSPVFLTGDSAIGSPYFQSISLGMESAMYLTGLLAQRDSMPLREMLDRYEHFIYKQWLRVYMRSKMIKHNKDLFESIDDPMALLEKLHIY
ncbi:MAG: FAD-dependent oxidoreductase [Thermoleophilia bacterium]